jgi:lipid A disaccharide synthetase
MNVAVVAGEASGDVQAANLLRELALQLPNIQVEAWGIGGPHLASAGCELIADSRTWGTMGVAASLSNVPGIFGALQRFKRQFINRRPDLLILVDFGAFNILLATWVKNQVAGNKLKGARSGHKCPIIYYFPPSSWRRKLSSAKLTKLTRVSDLIITPFSWSSELLNSAGGNAYFLGHPLLDTVHPTMAAEEFYSLYGLDKTKTVITLLPGSREHEVKYILPVMLAAAGEISRRLPGVQFLIARSRSLPRSLIEGIVLQAQKDGGAGAKLLMAQQAGHLLKHASSAIKPPLGERVGSLATPEGVVVPTEDKELTARAWAEKRMTSPSQSAPVAIVDNAAYDAMSRSDLVIAASGTATLEAAILGRPMIIVYLGSPMMNLEYKLRKKALNFTYIGLPNILAEEMVCPELIQNDATPLAIAEHALEMLLQPEHLMKTKTKLQNLIKENLGTPGATYRSAAKIVEFIKGDGSKAGAVPKEQC